MLLEWYDHHSSKNVVTDLVIFPLIGRQPRLGRTSVHQGIGLSVSGRYFVSNTVKQKKNATEDEKVVNVSTYHTSSSPRSRADGFSPGRYFLQGQLSKTQYLYP